MYPVGWSRPPLPTPDCLLRGDRPAAQTIRVKLRAKKMAQAVLSGEGEGGTPGPELSGKRKSRLGDCSVNAYLMGEFQRRGSQVMPATREPQSATTTGEIPRQRRTFHPGVLPLVLWVRDHSSGSQSQKGAPVEISCLYGTLPSRRPRHDVRRNVIRIGKFSERTAQESSFMKLAIAGLLLAASAGLALAQTSSPSPGPTSPGPSDSSAATGMAPGAPAERPRLQGNVPATSPGGPTSSESSGPDPSKPRTSTSPDKSDPSPK